MMGAISRCSQEKQSENLEHLTRDEQLSFHEFKELCAAGNLLTKAPEAGEDLTEGICDDGTLLRFLQAYKFRPQDAYRQYSLTRSWRETNRIISLYESIDIEDYELTRKMYTHWTGRRDIHGKPVFLFEIGKLTSHVLSAYNDSCTSPSFDQAQTFKHATEPIGMLRLFCTYEGLVRFVLPLCSAVSSRPNPKVAVTQTTCIVDMSGMGLLKFLRLRSHMQTAATLATSHYPETLGRIYIIGAPSIFSTVWTWINKWFDETTVSKITMVPPGEVLSTLSLMIDPADIPRKYGGQLDFEFGMMPDLDPEIRQVLAWSEMDSGKPYDNLPIGPIRWITGDDGKKTALAVGRVDGTQRRLQIASLVS